MPPLHLHRAPYDFEQHFVPHHWKAELNAVACFYRKLVRIGRSSTLLFVVTANCGGMETNCTGKSSPNSSLKPRTVSFKKYVAFRELPEIGLSWCRSHSTTTLPGAIGRRPSGARAARACPGVSLDRAGARRALAHARVVVLIAVFPPSIESRTRPSHG